MPESGTSGAIDSRDRPRAFPLIAWISAKLFGRKRDEVRSASLT